MDLIPTDKVFEDEPVFMLDLDTTDDREEKFNLKDGSWCSICIRDPIRQTTGSVDKCRKDDWYCMRDGPHKKNVIWVTHTKLVLAALEN